MASVLLNKTYRFPSPGFLWVPATKRRKLECKKMSCFLHRGGGRERLFFVYWSPFFCTSQQGTTNLFVGLFRFARSRDARSWRRATPPFPRSVWVWLQGLRCFFLVSLKSLRLSRKQMVPTPNSQKIARNLQGRDLQRGRAGLYLELCF